MGKYSGHDSGTLGPDTTRNFYISKGSTPKQQFLECPFDFPIGSFSSGDKELTVSVAPLIPPSLLQRGRGPTGTVPSNSGSHVLLSRHPFDVPFERTPVDPLILQTSICYLCPRRVLRKSVISPTTSPFPLLFENVSENFTKN